MNVSPSYVSDEDSGPYINGQPPTATGRATTPPTETQKSAEEDLFRQMQKSFAAREASHKSEKELDNYLAVLQGFLGVAGGDSPYFARNIGTGFTSGIASLANARKQQGLTERGLGREQLGLFTAKQSMDRAAEERKLRERALGTSERKLTLEEQNRVRDDYNKIKETWEKNNSQLMSQYNNLLSLKARNGKLSPEQDAQLNMFEDKIKAVEKEAKKISGFGGVSGGWSASIVKAPGT